MRLLTAAGALCVLGGSVTSAHATELPSLAGLRAPRAIAAPGDTLARVTFSIPALPLADALAEFSRQADVRVQLDAAAASGVRSRAVSGSYTAAEALRRLLDGTGLNARFNGVRTAVVTGAASEYSLTTLNVVAERRTGYAAVRSSTATKTDTPLRDTPQSVSVVTSEVIADQSMQGMADVVRYVPGVQMGQGEGHRDAPTIRGNASTADFFVDGVRDDAQYLRDLYNVERVEALKGSNAMIFGRGGGGGVLNRVTKPAGWAPVRTFTAETGSWDHKRTTVDVGQGLSGSLAARFNGMWENSEGFRDFSALRRYALNPTVALSLGEGTRVDAGYERFHDRRNVDRGIPSYQGRPSSAGVETFFGNPNVNYSRMDVNAATASVQHTAGGLTIRSRARFADYDKFYQNTFPGAVTADGSQVALSAYNHAIQRQNWFDQTDLVGHAATGQVRHTVLLGAEIGRQRTDQLRNTGYYNNTATSLTVPFASPTVTTPVTFRQSATDADNHTVATVAAVYLQEQAELTPWLQALGGLRYDRFNVDYHNNRDDSELSRRDELWSPRAGLVLKPMQALSFYGTYSVSYLPGSGDQFTSLTVTSSQLEPERFTNREVGAKWDVRPSLSLTAAVYRLDRTNTSAPDPADPSQIVQTGEARTTGFELGASGNITRAWQVVGGFASQRARIVSATSAAKAGAIVPLVPHQTMSLWNRVQVIPAIGVGLGVVRQSDMYAAIDNTVTLPGFTRADGALFLRLNPSLGAQVNVENLFDKRYYATSQGNNNIMPGATRTLRISLTARP